MIDWLSGSLRKIRLAKYNREILADKGGKISEIVNLDINNIARIAGSPGDKAAGIYLFNHVGDHVKKSQQLFMICSNSQPRLKQAAEFYKKTKPIKIK